MADQWVTHGEGVSLLAQSRTTGKRPSAEEQLMSQITELRGRGIRRSWRWDRR